MENQDSPPLDPTLAPALLFEPVHDGGSGADEKAGRETTDDDDDGTRFLYSIPKRRLLAVAGWFGDYLNSDSTWITPQGWVLVLDPVTRDASLRDPFSSRTVRLPPDHHHLLQSNEHTRCLLSTTPHWPADGDDDPAGCIVLLVHLEEPVLWYCSPGGSRWLRHEYSSELIASDHQTYFMRAMGRLTAARGKFYTYVYGGGGHDKIMALEFSLGPIFSSTHVERTPFVSRVLKHCLVESCGDLFLVRFCLEPFCAQAITKIYIYKKLVLSAINNAWVKVATLGDNRVFFFGSDGDSYEFGASMAAYKVGLKANCIYFTHDADKALYVHDLERGTTTLHNPYTDVPDSVKSVLLMRACLS